MEEEQNNKDVIIDDEEQRAIDSREEFEKNVSNIWGHSKIGLEAKKAYMTMLSTKTGMYARVPLICKADNCPYAESCRLLECNLAPLGETCPAEAAQIEMRFAGYNKQFNLDSGSFTDKSLVSELINLDIMADRCKALISKEQVPVIEVVTGVSEQGEEYSHPEVSKYWDAYERTLKRREEILQLMKATRKDKKDDDGNNKSDMEIALEALKNQGGFVEDTQPTDTEYEEVKD